MAKYITLEGLGHFLNTIKSDKFLAIDTCYGCIKTGYEENNNNYAIKVDTSAWATVEWTNNKVTAVDNHYQQSTKPTQTKYGIYNITIDAAGHITKSSTPQKNNFAGVWTELDEPIYKELTYATLKESRDNGSLAAGRLYRITDYRASSISNSNNFYSTKNIGQFDIIVEAISTSSISETAWVCHHEGDTYFAECELDKWEIKYCMDNDTNRFTWAKATGKGVIYYMKDEWGNEAPYDFKNLGPDNGFNSFLFNNSNSHDASVKGYKFDKTGETELPRKNNIFPTNNILKPKYTIGKMDALTAVWFQSVNLDMLDNFTGISNNYVDYNCSDVLFYANPHTNSYDGSNGYGCHNNIIARDCNHITIVNSNNNEIGTSANGIQLANCDNTKIGYKCSNICFIYEHNDNYSYDSNAWPSSIQKSKNNIIGNNLCNIYIGMDCNNNIFENHGGIDSSESILGHRCNNNLIKTNSTVDLRYHNQSGGTSFDLYTMNGLDNCIFNKCINSSQITILELGKHAKQYDPSDLNASAIGSFYFDSGKPLYDKYKFKNFEFVNISAKNNTYNFESLVYDVNNDNMSELPNYVEKLKGMFGREYRTLMTLKTTPDASRKLNSVSKYG